MMVVLVDTARNLPNLKKQSQHHQQNQNQFQQPVYGWPGWRAAIRKHAYI